MFQGDSPLVYTALCSSEGEGVVTFKILFSMFLFYLKCGKLNLNFAMSVNGSTDRMGFVFGGLYFSRGVMCGFWLVFFVEAFFFFFLKK